MYSVNVGNLPVDPEQYRCKSNNVKIKINQQLTREVKNVDKSWNFQALNQKVTFVEHMDLYRH